MLAFLNSSEKRDIISTQVIQMTQEAYILLNVQPGMLDAVHQGLNEMKEVLEVYAVYGIYDLIAKIRFETMDELKNQVLNNNIIIEGVKNSMTMICVN